MVLMTEVYKMADNDVDRLRNHIRAEISEFHAFPEGWPGSVELALIDTVLSIRARYGVTADSGVRGAIKRYKVESERTSWNDLTALAGVDVEWLQVTLANRQKTGGVPKAEAIVSAAGRLAQAGAIGAKDVDRDSSEQRAAYCGTRAAYCGTRGLGPVTWEYFLMLVGHAGVKADTLMSRFVAEALGRRPDSNEVARLVTETAERLGMPAADLDHTIWRYMSRPRRN
jgi:hypothetical protein